MGPNTDESSARRPRSVGHEPKARHTSSYKRGRLEGARLSYVDGERLLPGGLCRQLFDLLFDIAGDGRLKTVGRAEEHRDRPLAAIR